MTLTLTFSERFINGYNAHSKDGHLPQLDIESQEMFDPHLPNCTEPNTEEKHSQLYLYATDIKQGTRCATSFKKQLSEALKSSEEKKYQETVDIISVLPNTDTELGYLKIRYRYFCI